MQAELADLLRPVPAPESTPTGERILAAAAELFYLRGITATGVDLIVERAGTTKRTLYQRFGSKDQLVAACLAERAHRWQTHVLSQVEPAADPLSTFYVVAEEWTREHRRGCAFVNAAAEIDLRAHPAGSVVRDEKRWMLRLFCWLAEGDDDAGRALHLLYEGAQVAARIEQDPTLLRSALAASRQVLAAGAQRG